MRYYVVAIQFNKDAGAENRTAPKAYDSKNDALAEWHRQVSTDMKNSTLGWSVCILFDSDGAVHRSEKYIADIPETTSEE